MFNNLMEREYRQALEEDNSIVLIDVRTEGEHRQGHIPNSLHIDMFSPDLAEKIQSLDKGKNYFVYCRSGARSANVCSMMGQMGFNKLTNLFGGLFDWHGEIVTLA
jgi:rhodanese-related sulfurtransferase